MRLFSAKIFLFIVTALLFAGCARIGQTLPNVEPQAIAPQTAAPRRTFRMPTISLADARRNYRTQLVRQTTDGHAIMTPPAKLFQTVSYPSSIGKLAAYLSADPRDGKKHPAIIWIFGGFSNSIDDGAWQPAPVDNDQSASAFRRAGIVMMYPSLRGGNKNPGFKEGFYGEVDDVLAAANYLSTQPFVDPNRIYLGGHSTGGTLALLASEMPNRFRATFAFGPVTSPRTYGADEVPFDVTNKTESMLRAPVYWMKDVSHPTFVFEGMDKPSNYTSLQILQKYSTNPNLHFLPVPRASHFSILAPTTKLIAQKIVQDTGATMNISFSQTELNGLMQ